MTWSFNGYTLMRQSMEVLISHVFSQVKVDLGSRGRCQVLFTPGILSVISMGPCIWYSFVSIVAGLDVFVVSLDFTLTLDSSSITGPSFPRKAPTACATPGTSHIRSLHASSRSPSRTLRPLVLLRPRGDGSPEVTGAPRGSLRAKCVVVTVSPCLIIYPFFPSPLKIDPAGRTVPAGPIRGCVMQVGQWYSGWYVACYVGGYSFWYGYCWRRRHDGKYGSLSSW